MGQQVMSIRLWRVADINVNARAFHNAREADDGAWRFKRQRRPQQWRD
jgi:hypothetical protein